MHCQSCGHENRTGAEFCGQCGTGLSPACPSCGHSNPRGQKFCGECGSRLPDAPGPQRSPASYTPRHLADRILTSRFSLEGERKLVTVLFCDIANSTELAARAGAESMHAILQGFFEKVLEEVHRFEGTVNQFLGDGCMALFGAPIAHEDHARRAALAALSLREALQEQQQQAHGLPTGSTLQVRMGLHTGHVVVGSIGDNLRMDYTAVGDTTHLAARLQQVAAPGQIVMSDATARLVKGYVVSEVLAPLALKGWPEPVPIFDVSSPGSRRSSLERDRALSPFVGRGNDLALLEKSLKDAQGGRGCMVGIVGEPGVGKSRLLHEFRRANAAQPFNYVEGRCLSFGQAIPYLPLQDVLRAISGIEPSDSPATIGGRIRGALHDAGLAGDELAPYLLKALGIREGSESLDPIGPETVKVRIRDTLLQLLLAQGRKGVTVLVVEDLHWIDRISEEFVARLADNISGGRILFVTTARPGYMAPWQGKGHVTQLPLQVLPADAARRIVESATGKAPLSEAAASSIVRKAEGNPFFLEEMSLALLDHGDLGSVHALPDTIQSVLAARIDRLPDAAKRALQTCAILGREFALRLLEAIESEPQSLRDHLGILVAQEFLYSQTTGGEMAYVFKHALTQEVAYDGLLTARKEALHEAAGHAMEQVYSDRLEEHYEMLAHHYARSRNARKAIQYLDYANQKARNAHSVQDAQSYFDEALRHYSRLADSAEVRRSRVALTVRQAPVYMVLMKMVEYQGLLEATLQEAEGLGDEGLLGRFLACLGHCHWFGARYDEAIRVCLRASELSRNSGVWDGSAHGLMLVQWSWMYLGAMRKVVDIEADALQALTMAPNPLYRMWSLTVSSWACANMGRWDDAMLRAQQAISDGEAVSDLSLVAFGLWIRGVGHVQKGNIEAALRDGRAAVDAAPTDGDKAWAGNLMLWALAKQSPNEAIDQLKPRWEFFRTTGFKGVIAFSGSVLAEAYLGADRLHDLEETAGIVIDLCRDCGQRFWEGVAHRLLAEGLCRHDPSRAVEAGEHADAAIRLLRECGAEPDLARALETHGRIRRVLGDVAAAREHLQGALAIYERLDMLIEPEGVRRELAALAATMQG